MRKGIMVGALLALGACAGEQGVPGIAGKSSLVSVVAEPQGEHCPAGGRAIRTGIDQNANGALDESEVAATEYVCNGADGHDGETTLFDVRDEPAGEHCASGGKALCHGLDADRDGRLDEGEVAGTEYVCNGAPGVGMNSLVSVIAEPAGFNCANGGQAIRSGIDTSADGMLQPGEVNSTAYVCNGDTGLSSLTRQEDELPGADCAHGGRSLSTGLDADSDGYLDPSEVASISYVCNGADGADGAPGHASLVLTEAEAPGASCVSGGLRVSNGLDLDDDGALETAEITSTSYVCDGGAEAVRVTNAAWGGVCARGGIKVDTGIDLDADGLEDSEVERTQYVCNRFIAQIAAGNAHTCALISDGSVRCFGSNNAGQLGNGGRSGNEPMVPVIGVSTAVAVTAASMHSCALLADGTVRCWGDNGSGQLGDGTTTHRTESVAVIGLSSVVALSAAGGHTCAVLASRSVRCWGTNSAAELGDGSTTRRSSPVAVTGLTDVVAISSGTVDTCVVLTDGSARCWGYNGDGQLGDGTTTNRSAPVAVAGASSLVSIAAGQYHTCAMNSTGKVLCWGGNGWGQLGNGSTTASLSPVQVTGLPPQTRSLTVGDAHSCAIGNGLDRNAWCWGGNARGSLGNGSTTDRSSPVRVVGLPESVSLSAGGFHTCALISDGTARCWGNNNYGQVGDGTTLNRLNPVVVEMSLAP